MSLSYPYGNVMIIDADTGATVPTDVHDGVSPVLKLTLSLQWHEVITTVIQRLRRTCIFNIIFISSPCQQK